MSRIPVCRACLALPEPLSAEFFCVSCRTPFHNAFPLDAEGRCAVCRSGLRGFDAAYSFGAYEGVLRELVHLYKYSRIRTLARPLSGLLAAALPPGERFDALVPVPLHWRRQWQRGFNQSELLAREIRRRTGIPMILALKRVRSTPAQASLARSSRRGNVATAFQCRRIVWSLHGKRVLLIDDVMTTGSTAASCALALKRAGVARVAILTVARADRRIDAAHLVADHSMVGGSV